MKKGTVKTGFKRLLKEIFVDKYNCIACDTELCEPMRYGVCDKCYGKLEFTGDNICKKCGRIQNNEADFCLTCQEHAREFDFSRSCVVYNDIAKDIVRGIKFGHKKYFGKYLAAYITDRYDKDFSSVSIDCIIPVPLTRKRRKERGYNQSEVIAKHLAEEREIPMDASLVVKIKDNKEQAKLTGKEREQNVLGVYELSRKDDVKGKTFLIIDDVMTTGSTLSEIAGVLKKAKAKEVFGLTFASTRYKLQGENLVLEEEYYEDQMV